MTPTVPQVGGGTGGGEPQTRFTLVNYWNGLVFGGNTLKQIPIEGGYVTFNGSTPQYHFYIQDHQGNNRLVCDESGSIEQVNHYYPYGGLMGESEDITSTQRYKYNGKELDRMHGLNLYDYGARQYDATVGKFTTMDPLAEKYYNVSPYAYCVGNPVNAIDPDGNVIIFINGFHNGFQGASTKYWSNDFDKAVMSHFNDNNSKYLDGSLGGVFGLNKYWLLSNLNPIVRYNAGLRKGLVDAESLIANLKRDIHGNIIESIRLVSHSMGGAYAKGYAQALQNYIKSHPETTSGASITEYDFAPYEATMQESVQGVETYQYSHKHDWVAGNKRIEGAQYMKTSDSLKDGHAISSFKQYIPKLKKKMVHEDEDPQNNYESNEK
jgi:RHS repeat-associated protein